MKLRAQELETFLYPKITMKAAQDVWLFIFFLFLI